MWCFSKFTIIVNYIDLITAVIALPAQVAYHEPLVSAWFEIISTDYKDSHYTSSTDAVSEADARRNAL